MGISNKLLRILIIPLPPHSAPSRKKPTKTNHVSIIGLILTLYLFSFKSTWS